LEHHYIVGTSNVKLSICLWPPMVNEQKTTKCSLLPKVFYSLSYPAPDPVRFPLMYQSWCDLTFLHWRYPVEVIRRLVPQPLEVESFDGSAWVGITPFVLRGLRPVLVPPFPWLSAFPETNCRTYIRGPDGRSGVWFFSLDSARALAVMGARLAFGLPYAWSQMRVVRNGRQVSYQSTRLWPRSRARTSITVNEGVEIESGAIELFLTARFRLYSFIRGHLTYTAVEHPPWPLKSAQIVSAEQTLTAAAGLPEPAGPPIVHFSPGVRVRVARPKRVQFVGKFGLSRQTSSRGG
jgi:uncharacterized protein YqjF (DUF2071 family)